VPFNLREFSRDIAHWVDPGDASYYADATAEARRREAAVEQARQAKAEQELAARRQAEAEATAAKTSKQDEEAARMQAEKAAKEKAEKEQAEKQRLAMLSDQEREKAERMQAEQAKAEARAAADRQKAEAEKMKAEAAAEAKRMAAAEQAKAEAERQKAEAALAAQKAGEAERAKAEEKARKQAEEEARKSASKSTGVEKFLDDADEVMVLNEEGKKYNKVKFNHLAHASKKYVPDGECQTCHHNLEDKVEKPEPCNSCHDIGGDADEDNAKKHYVHEKDKGFPKEKGQDEVSCVGCHKSQNELLEMGKRKGKKAPIKCTQCHTRK